MCRRVPDDNPIHPEMETAARKTGLRFILNVLPNSEKRITAVNEHIQGWLAALKDDKRFIVSAAGKAEKAVRLILGECDSYINQKGN